MRKSTVGRMKTTPGSPFECQECGQRFRRKIGPRTSDIKCPKCGSCDTLPLDFFVAKFK
jgi:DNA-directed RNA polymerase subunit RPC12/RpoP